MNKLNKDKKGYLQRATITLTVASKDINKISHIINYAVGLGIDVEYKSLKPVCR